jgi:hypothetical protein
MRVAIPFSNLMDEDGLTRIEGITKLRFGRSERETQGSNLLLERLRKEVGRPIEYDGDRGSLFVRSPDGGMEINLVGDLAELIFEMSRDAKCSPKALVEKMIEDEHERLAGQSYDQILSKRDLREMEAEQERRAARKTR